MTKKRSSEILGVKMEKFSRKKRHWKSWSAKSVSVPQTRRKVSATECTSLLKFSGPYDIMIYVGLW